MKNFNTRQIDNYLKSIYLGAASEALNTCYPVFAKFNQTTSDVWGKEIRKLEKYEPDEKAKYYQYVSPLKSLYMVLRLPQKIDKVSDITAMQDIIARAFTDMQNHASHVMSLELFADGYGLIKDEKFSEIDGLLAPQKICGFGYIFDNDKPLYGLPRDRDCRRTTILDWSKKSNVELLNALSDKVLDHDCDMIVTSGAIKRAIQDALIATRQNIDILSVKGGYKAISINGVPLISDRNCDNDCIYILNTSDFNLHQLCDWRWLEDDSGRIIRQWALPNDNDYYAVLVKYADLICDNVQNQIKIKVGERK